MGEAKCRATKILPETFGGGIFGLFSNFGKCRPEVADDVISNAALDYVSVDALAKFSDSKLKGSRIFSTLWPAGPVLHTSVQYLIPFFSAEQKS